MTISEPPPLSRLDEVSPDAEIVLEVRDVSKIFRLYDDMIAGPAKEMLFFWRKRKPVELHRAVNKVSFQVRRGEVVGVVGRNGAGKTTLMKMIAGMLRHDEGEITVKGRVTAVLALGIGVHPEFSGRENIYYGGLLLGLDSQEIDARMDSIIDFAELREVIEHPFRTYSSGMRARLLFAIATCVDPDILIIDEALATGDRYFVQKCQRRIMDICNSGATVLMVSHDLKQIADQCHRCILLQGGRVIYDGPTRDGLDLYIDTVHAEIAEKLDHRTATGRTLSKVKGTGQITVEDAYFLQDGERTNTLTIGKPCRLIIELQAAQALPDATFIIQLYSEKSPITYAFVQLFDLMNYHWSARNLDLENGRSRIALDIASLDIGDGTYFGHLKFFSSDPSFVFSDEACYACNLEYISFQAVYKNKIVFGRGTLCEIPISAIAIERP